MGRINLTDMAAFNEEVQAERSAQPPRAAPYNLRGDYNQKQEAHKQELAERETDFVQDLAGAWQFDTLTGALTGEMLRDANQTYDPEFNAFEFDDFRPMDSTEEHMISGALNAEHYAAIRDTLEKRREYKADMEARGFLGSLPVYAAAEFGNLTNYIIPGSGAVKGIQGYKRLAAAGLIQGSANIAETAGIDAIYKDRTLAEYLATGGLGFGLGAAFGSLGVRTKNPKEVADQIDRIKRTAEGYAQTNIQRIADDSVGAARIKPVLDPNAADRMRNNKLNPDSVGAQETFIALEEGKIPQRDPLVESKIGLGSQGYSTQTSRNPMLRKAGYDILEKPEVGLDKADDLTVSTYLATKNNWLASTYLRPTNELFQQFKVTDKELLGDFNKFAMRVRHTGDYIDEVSPEGNKILQAWADLDRQVWNKIVDEGHAAGVTEFANKEIAKKYITRSVDPSALFNMSKVHSEDAVIELLYKGIKGDGGQEKVFQQYVDKAVKDAEKAQAKATTPKKLGQIQKVKDQITEATAKLNEIKNTLSAKGQRAAVKLEKLHRKLYKLESAANVHWRDYMDKGFDIDETMRSMAKAYYNRMSRRALNPTRDANLLNTGNQTLLKDVIMESDMTTAQKTAVLHVLDTQGRDVAGIFGKDRMHFDMNATHMSPITGEEMRFIDMFNTDVGAGRAMSLRYWTGRTGLAMQGPQYKDIPSINQFRDDIKKHGESIDMDSKEIIADDMAFESMIKQSIGEPLENQSRGLVTTSRILRKLTGLNVMNKIIFPQMGETGRALAAVGIKNIVKNIPELGNLIKRAKSGTLTPEIVRNIEDSVLGKIGDDHMWNLPAFRGEDLGHQAGKFENTLNTLGYYQGKAFGWHYVHTAQRKFVINGLAQRWYKEITSGTMSQARKNDIGLTPRLEAIIKGQMESYAVTRKTGWGSQKVKNLHMENWTPEAAQAFGQMLTRKSSNAIQQILMGEVPAWMNKEVGKVLLQFRTFSVAAMAKQGRRDVNILKMGDTEPINAFMFSLATASMSMVAKISWDAMTSDDPNDYLKEHLTPDNIARQALIYNGQVGWGVDIIDSTAGVLAPEVWNPVMGRQGYQPVRGVSGLVPSVGYVDRALRGAKSTVDIINPYEEATSADVRAATGYFPYQNSVVADLLLAPLPDKEK